MRIDKRCKCEKPKRCSHPYHARFKAAGREYELSTHTANRAEATVEGSRLQVERRQAGAHAREGCRLSRLAAEHIAEKTAEFHTGAISAARVTAVTDHWTPVLRHLGPDFDANELCGPRAFDHLKDMRDTRLKTVRGQTFEREYWNLNEGLRIGWRKRWLRAPPLPRDEWPVIGHDKPDEARAGKIHRPEVIAGVWAELDQDWQDRLEVDAATGLRKHELLRFSFSWVVRAPSGLGCAAFIRPPDDSTKDGDERLLPIQKRVLEIIERRFAVACLLAMLSRLGGHKPTDPATWPVFPGDRKKSLYSAIERAQLAAVTRLGEDGAVARGYFRNVTLRDLRHGFSTAAEKRTKDKLAVADLLGHDRLSTTEIYLHSDLPRVIEAASAAGGWLNDALGGAKRGEQDSSYIGGEMLNQLYFQPAALVGTTGIEPVTPTVSRKDLREIRSNIKESTRHRRHERSQAYTDAVEQRGGARRGGR
jgi:hypothetical protein